MTTTREARYRADRRAPHHLGTALITLAVVAAILLVLAIVIAPLLTGAVNGLNDTLSNPTTSTGVTP